MTALVAGQIAVADADALRRIGPAVPVLIRIPRVAPVGLEDGVLQPAPRCLL
jgi:hypothetical protein